MGFWVTALSFILWGLMPPYWKWYNGCDPLELIAHRISWGALCMAVFFTIKREWRRMVGHLKDGACLRLHAVSAVLILINWLTFVWAIIHDRILETSLGYYLVPLLNVAIGHFFLKESLRALRRWAIGFAAGGVCIFFFLAGKVPLTALILAGTFSLYGLISKRTPLTAMERMGMECFLLLPLAGGYLLWLAAQGQGLLLQEHGVFLQCLAPTAGIITVVPLILFTWGAQRVEFSTVGLLQFTAPSMTFLTAILLYKEPFSQNMGLAFLCIWTALVLYSIDLIRQSRKLFGQRSLGGNVGRS